MIHGQQPFVSLVINDATALSYQIFIYSQLKPVPHHIMAHQLKDHQMISYPKTFGKNLNIKQKKIGMHSNQLIISVSLGFVTLKLISTVKSV